MIKSKVQKDEAYSKLMMDVANFELVDESMEVHMKLPPWFDPEKNKKGQRFEKKNFHSFLSAAFSSLIVIATVPSILKVLMSTKRSSTVAAAYRRYKLNVIHSQFWMNGCYEEGSLAWKSFKKVRQIHTQINSRAKKADSNVYITQAGMACTQYLYIGLQISQFYGILNHATLEELEDYNHHVRAIGYMLGIKDEFNICGATFAETQRRVEAINEDFFKPNIMNPVPEYLGYAKIALAGMWHFDQTLHFDTVMYQLKRALGVPGYYYFESERQKFETENSNMKILQQFSYYTRMRIFIDIVIFEYLTKFAIFRYLLVIFRLSVSLLEVFPILLMISFGRKFAMAEMKRENSFNRMLNVLWEQ